jgi:hypothetical protein
VRPSTAPHPRAVLSLVLGALLALPTTSALASTNAPTPRERSQILLAEGDVALEKGELEEAISKYRSSYYGLSAADQASYMGSLPVRKAMQAYEQQIAKEQDPGKRRALLQRQLVLLEEFLDAVTAKAGAVDEVGDDVIAELAETRRTIEAALAGPTKPEVPPVDPQNDASADPDQPTPETDQGSPPATTTTDAPKPPRDWLGLGLVIGGSTLLATGLGVTVGWWTIRNTAQANVDGNDDFAEGTDARADYLAGEEDRARTFLIAGSVVAGVGLATTIGGVVRLVVHRRRATARTTAMHVVPILSPDTHGLVLQRRF